ncbi:MAG: hypothetical protein SPD11_04285, partial [Sphaerochaetaceae bacterium]|nr:hypothetical protein [Sphaerochaetaceae bacterium]
MNAIILGGYPVYGLQREPGPVPMRIQAARKTTSKTTNHFSSSHQAVGKQSASSRQAVAKQSASSRQAVTKQS